MCYFLASPSTDHSPHADDYKKGVQEIIDMMVKTQQKDGYLDCYFSVVDKEGRFKNLRDMHEMCESGADSVAVLTPQTTAVTCSRGRWRTTAGPAPGSTSTA